MMFWGMSMSGRRTAGTRDYSGAPADGSAWRIRAIVPSVYCAAAPGSAIPRDLRFGAPQLDLGRGPPDGYRFGFRVARTIN